MEPGSNKGSNMASFSKDKKTGAWKVLGLATEVVVGSVAVSLASGGTKTVHVVRVSPPFTAKFGPLAGKVCVFGDVGGEGGGRSSGGGNRGPRCCSECGEVIKSKTQRCWETGGACFSDD